MASSAVAARDVVVFDDEDNTLVRLLVVVLPRKEGIGKAFAHDALSAKSVHTVPRVMVLDDSIQSFRVVEEASLVQCNRIDLCIFRHVPALQTSDFRRRHLGGVVVEVGKL
jgi:hypothetical protein